MINNLLNLLKGFDTKPASPPTEFELQIIQSVLAKNETVERLARGRNTSHGWSVWALTQSRVLCFNNFGAKKIRIYTLANITHTGNVKGAWGSVLDLYSGASHEHLFAVNPQVADAFINAIDSKTPQAA